jgi:hypothetical protein
VHVDIVQIFPDFVVVLQRKTKATSTSNGIAAKEQQISSAQEKLVKKKLARKSAPSQSDGPILGGVDYVSLHLGGRRKAAQEALKLPRNSN